MDPGGLGWTGGLTRSCKIRDAPILQNKMKVHYQNLICQNVLNL